MPSFSFELHLCFLVRAPSGFYLVKSPTRMVHANVHYTLHLKDGKGNNSRLKDMGCSAFLSRGNDVSSDGRNASILLEGYVMSSLTR
jgi:hypothetical protein